MNDITYITKKEIQKNINILYKKINNNKKYDYIVGIKNGGLNISIPLSKKLKISHRSIRISFYNYCETQYPQIINLESIMKLPKTGNFLFVDDILDSGKTINWLNTNIKEYFYYDVAVCYWNSYNIYEITPTYFAEYKPLSHIIFPWIKK